MAAPQETDPGADQLQSTPCRDWFGVSMDSLPMSRGVVPDSTVRYVSGFPSGHAASHGPNGSDDFTLSLPLRHAEGLGWRPAFDLEMMTRDMLCHLRT